MTDVPQLEDALVLALQLPPKERLKLVERVVASVENELAIPEKAGEGHWGATLVQALESGEIDTSEWVRMDIDDPVEWVNQIRKEESDRLAAYWNEKE